MNLLANTGSMEMRPHLRIPEWAGEGMLCMMPFGVSQDWKPEKLRIGPERCAGRERYLKGQRAGSMEDLLYEK